MIESKDFLRWWYVGTMNSGPQALKNLLLGELPLEKVGPHLRHSVKRALCSGDPRRLTQVALVVVGELLRRGDLLRVAVEGSTDQAGPLYLLKGTTRLLDLSVLGGDPASTIGITLPERGETVAGAATPGRALESPYHPDDFAGILGVMEQAQELEIGNPSSGESGVVLTGILRLLERLTPQFNLYIMVDDAELKPEDQDFLFQLQNNEPSNGWLKERKSGQSFWIPDPGELPLHIQNQERKIREDQGPWRGQGYSCAVAIPLWEPVPDSANEEDRREAGLFFLVARESWSKDAMLKLARRLTSFVSRRWQRQSEVNQRIHKDRLTGVFNRAYFEDQFTLELERSRRSQAPLTLVIADLDHFKLVNDKYGHQVGDIILNRMARRLQSQLRRIDSICRIGGEEFALILPHTSVGAGRDVIQRLLGEKSVEEFEYIDETLTIDVTFSYGTATFPDAGADAFELYRKADAMLFLSKDKGRNQCHIWNSDGDHIQLLPGSDST